MQEFAYLRSGDKIGAPIHRIVVARSQALLLARSNDKMLEVPEGKEALEYRKEREEAGVEFKYRLVTFKDWLEAQNQEDVRKWKGLHEDSVYSDAPDGTFWSEFAPEGAPWTLQLLSLETGERVEGHEELVEKATEELLEKSANKKAKPETAPESSEKENTDEEPSEEENAPEESTEGDTEPSEEEKTPAEAEEVTE